MLLRAFVTKASSELLMKRKFPLELESADSKYDAEIEGPMTRLLMVLQCAGLVGGFIRMTDGLCARREPKIRRVTPSGYDF